MQGNNKKIKETTKEDGGKLLKGLRTYQKDVKAMQKPDGKEGSPK